MNTISVVIPVRNRPNKILAAIDSVRTQTLAVHEIIVVDDASTDSTGSVLQRLADIDTSIHIITLPENRGGAVARNVGLDYATGEFVAFLDSDDIWQPDRLSRQLEQVGTAAPADFLCFTNLAVDRHDNRPPDPWNTLPFDTSTEVAEFLINQSQAIQTSTWLMPLRTARRIAFNERLRRHQDVDFALRAAVQGVSFIYVSAPLVVYSADPGEARISSRIDAAPSLQWLEVAKAYLDSSKRDYFYITNVFDIDLRENPLAAMGRALAGVARRSYSPREFFRRLRWAATPNWLRRLHRSLGLK